MCLKTYFWPQKNIFEEISCLILLWSSALRCCPIETQLSAQQTLYSTHRRMIAWVERTRSRLSQHNGVEFFMELLKNNFRRLSPTGGFVSPSGRFVSPSGRFASLSFDQVVSKNSQHHLADRNAICILNWSDCVWLCCLLYQGHTNWPMFLLRSFKQYLVRL